MDKIDAEQMVLYLCWKALVKPCRVDWSKRHVRGCYSPGQRAIKVGPESHRSALDPVDRLLHEVAHHVTSERGRAKSGIPRQPAARRRFFKRYPGMRHSVWEPGPNGTWKRWGRVHHGPTFVEHLKELAQLWYGDHSAYPWHREYRSLRKTE